MQNEVTQTESAEHSVVSIGFGRKRQRSRAADTEEGQRCSEAWAVQKKRTATGRKQSASRDTLKSGTEDEPRETKGIEREAKRLSLYRFQGSGSGK